MAEHKLRSLSCCCGGGQAREATFQEIYKLRCLLAIREQCVQHEQDTALQRTDQKEILIYSEIELKKVVSFWLRYHSFRS